jgi:hypothetical protein
MTTAVSSVGDVNPTIEQGSGIEQVVDTVSSESICESLQSGELLYEGLPCEKRFDFFKPFFFAPL